MRFYPTKIQSTFVCFFLFSILLNLGCSKDSDLLLDSVINEPISTVEEEDVPQDTEETENDTQTDTDEESTDEESQEPHLESRTTSFSPTNDAHYQSGKGYNQNIIRLDEGNRTSYLMFNLQPIDDINGEITGVTLQLTVDSDDGSGNVEVFKGDSSDWSENNLSPENIPEINVQIGSILKEYTIGETEFIELTATHLNTEISSLILNHKNGNDLAFASKEHPSKIGPKLVVTYSVPIGSDEIFINQEEGVQEDTNQNDNTSNQEPIAIADASPSSGEVPLEVTFKGSNSSDDEEIVSYFWNFKDGTTAAVADPIHTFTTAGVYEAILTTTDSEGLNSTDIVVITATEEPNTAPNAKASATPLTGNAPLEVSFQGSESTDDHMIASYVWDFKDGQVSNTANPVHTYTEPGTYNTTLTVTDENGLTDKSSIEIIVEEKENVAPVARTSANTTQGDAPLTVQFTGSNSSDDKEITGYSWNFKDGSNAATANPSHTFDTPGTFVVELTVNDQEGLTHSNTITILVTEPAPVNQAPVANIITDKTSGDAPLTIQFTGNNSTDDKGVTSYFWNFKDGTTSTNADPSHTFNQTGTYIVDLTVQDAEGLNNTKSITINANAPANNAPPGFYVATNGNASNSGTSPSSPWSLEYAVDAAKAGDIVYVKAGNYGNKQLLFSKNNGNNGAVIKFMGYRNTPGDITSNQGSTFNFGESVNSTKMPLLSSANGQGSAITVYNRYIEFENFQISGYATGILTIATATNLVFKNMILTNIGNQNTNEYDGFGFSVQGNNTLIENCFVQNATAEAIKLFDSDFSRINNCKVYATNSKNPTDYYFFITGGTNNSVIENCLADRAQGLSHGGHGFDIKDLGEFNTIRNCTARRTNFELNFSGVKNNTMENNFIYGVNTSASNWHAGLVIFNGANNNLIKNMLIQDTWSAISWADDDDGYVGPGGDRDEISMGHDNTFENITVKNTNRVLNVGGGTVYNAWARRNTFKNCNFSDFMKVAATYYPTEDIRFENCSFTNGQYLVIEAQGRYAPYSNFDVSWVNSTWTNVNFPPPN